MRPDTIRVGDAFTRPIPVTVSDALSIVLPPIEPARVPGLAVYPDPARVDDTGGERGARIVGTRVETVAYVSQEEGEYRLPGIEISWWDVGAARTARIGRQASWFARSPVRAAVVRGSLTGRLTRTGTSLH